MTTSYVITDQEYKLLDLAAYGEVNGSPATQYNLVNGHGVQPLTEMTIQQVLDKFSEGGDARGRYQFLGSTLDELVNKTGIDRNLLFNEQVQDFLGLQLLHEARLEQWKKGVCPDVRGSHKPRATTNHEAFLMNLATIWAAKPIPFAINDRVIKSGTYKRPRNSTYYAGPNNNSKGTASAHIADLEAILEAGPGQSYTINFGSTSRPYPAAGRSIAEQAEVNAGGGQNYRTQARPYANTTVGSLQDARRRGVAHITPLQPGIVNAGRPSPMAGLLPQVSMPYVYKKIDPLDNRYDFRTGEKVVDLLINGVNPASTYPINESMRHYGDPSYIPTKASLGGELDTPAIEDYDSSQTTTTSPPTTDTPTIKSFNPKDYTVHTIIPKATSDDSGNIAVIRNTGSNRSADYVVGEEIYRGRSGSAKEVFIITVEKIDPDLRTVTLSDGSVLRSANLYGPGVQVVGGKIQETSPTDEVPSGEYKTINGALTRDIVTLNSIVREVSDYVTVVPVDLGDEFIYYVSADYYKESSNRYPLTAFTPTPVKEPGIVYATQITKLLGGALPSKELVEKIEGKSNISISPPSTSPIVPEYNDDANSTAQSASPTQGQIVTGIKIPYHSSSSGGNKVDPTKGVRIWWGQINKQTAFRSGPITTLRQGINIV